MEKQTVNILGTEYTIETHKISEDETMKKNQWSGYCDEEQKLIVVADMTEKEYVAIDSALADIKNGNDYPPPMHLRDTHYKDAKKYGFGMGYVYSHDNPDYEQQFMPEELINRKYID